LSNPDTMRVQFGNGRKMLALGWEAADDHPARNLRVRPPLRVKCLCTFALMATIVQLAVLCFVQPNRRLSRFLRPHSLFPARQSFLTVVVQSLKLSESGDSSVEQEVQELISKDDSFADWVTRLTDDDISDAGSSHQFLARVLSRYQSGHRSMWTIPLVPLMREGQRRSASFGNAWCKYCEHAALGMTGHLTLQTKIEIF